MTANSWVPDIGEFPYPPENVEVVSPMFIGALDIRWDDPALLTGPYCPVSPACADLTIYGSATNKPFVLTQAVGALTVLSGPFAAGTVLTLHGMPLTSVSGARTSGNSDFNSSLGSSALIAAELADAINDAANPFTHYFLATAVGTTVILEAQPSFSGNTGNALTLATGDASLVTVSGATLAGGVDADTITIGGVATLTAVSGVRTSGQNDFSIDGSTFDIAQSIADAINDPANNFTSLVTATAQFGNVTLLAVALGVKGNGIVLETSNPVLLRFSGATLCGGTGVEGCDGKNNSRWQIIGVNVYRSDTGERGPYFRLNDIPISNRFYRDQTDNVPIDEVVDWNSGWLSKGNSPNNPSWVFCTRFRPIVKRSGQAVHANQPQDVTVTIDGVTVPVHSVFGPTGEITLINVQSYDLATEKILQPVLPKTDGTSVVTVRYYVNRNLVKTDLDQNNKIFYRVTTVAIDQTGTSPSGLIETPLGWAPPKNVHEVEALDYIWREAIRRNTWVLQQGGERVKLFQKRVTGIPCPCRRREQLNELYEHPYAQGLIEPGPPDSRCSTCYGTGFVSGYEGPIDIIISPDDAERRVSQGANGRRLEHSYEIWTGPSPVITQRDFIVKQTGERYSVGPVRRPSSRGRPLQQHFNLAYIDEQDIRYQVPVTGITELTWPETRTTDQRTECNDGDPHPVGFDYQASTMQTDKDNIPDEREQRGRTPVWENITY